MKRPDLSLAVIRMLVDHADSDEMTEAFIHFVNTYERMGDLDEPAVRIIAAALGVPYEPPQSEGGKE